MDGLDDAGASRGPLLAEEPVPVGPIVGLVVGLCIVGLGLHRWFGGDDRPIDSWVATPLVLTVIALTLGRIRRLVIARRWHRLYRALGIDPDEIGKTGVYRSPPDPRRTRRQRFIDLFTDEVDRSNQPPPHTLAGRIGAAALVIFDAVFRLVYPLFPLLAVLFDRSAVDLVCIGGWWALLCLRQLLVLARSRRRRDVSTAGR